jgi:integrase
MDRVASTICHLKLNAAKPKGAAYPAQIRTLGEQCEPGNLKRLPVVLTREEVRTILDLMGGASKLVAILLYGAGLRLNECLEFRFKDIDFKTTVQKAMRQAVLRGGICRAATPHVLPHSLCHSIA